MALQSRIKQVFLDINNIAKSILDKTQPAKKDVYPKLFKYINIWDMQVDEMIQSDKNKNYSFNTPSFFVQIELGEGVDWRQNFTSYPNAIIRFYLINQVLNSGDDMEQNLKIFDIRDQTVTAFKNSQISWCSDIILFEDEMDYKHGSIYKYKLGFKTNFIDSKGSIYDVDSLDPKGNIGNLEIDETLENNNAIVNA